MTKEKKKTMAPKVRFPEFMEEPTWSERKLSEVLKEHGSKSTGAEEVFSVSVHKGIINQIKHLGRSFSAATTDHYKRVLPGDVVYTKSPTGDFPYGIIKQSKNSKPVIVSPLYGVFTPETNALGCMLDAYFESPSNTINYLSSIVQKGAKNTINISNGTFLSKSLFLPTNKKEQQKIAATLTSLDDLISAQSEKIKALQAHKKGLMQQLFPAEGERAPRVRFGEFEGSGEWEEKAFGEIGTFLNGRAYKQDELLEKGKYRVLRVGNFFSNNQWYYSDLELEENKYCEKGDLLYAWSASFGPRIWTGEKVIYHYHIWKVIEKKEIDKKFLFLLLDYETEKIKVQQANGLGLLHITKSAIEAWECRFPRQKKEQQKIADTLSSLDDLITTQHEKLEVLKAHKKGLMQQLFPNPNDEAI
jgi:type I restriction enzyme S subunit